MIVKNDDTDPKTFEEFLNLNNCIIKRIGTDIHFHRSVDYIMS